MTRPVLRRTPCSDRAQAFGVVVEVDVVEVTGDVVDGVVVDGVVVDGVVVDGVVVDRDVVGAGGGRWGGHDVVVLEAEAPYADPAGAPIAGTG
jgi:hypothetical protein